MNNLLLTQPPCAVSTVLVLKYDSQATYFEMQVVTQEAPEAGSQGGGDTLVEWPQRP